MMNFVARLFARGEPAFSEARPADAAAIAAVHAARSSAAGARTKFIGSCRRATSSAIARTNGGTLIGFILSRLAAGEAEILSVAIAPAWRGRAPGAASARSASAALGRARCALGVPGGRRTKCARPEGFIAAPASARSAGDRAIMKAAQRHWCCAATSADALRHYRYNDAGPEKIGPYGRRPS